MENPKDPDQYLQYLRSPQEYAGEMFSAPFLFQSKKNSQELVFFGSEHTKDLKHPQWKQIEALFEDFVQSHKKENAVVFMEIFIPTVDLPKEKMIETYGECGLLAYLCHQSRPPCLCPEPTQDQILERLKETQKFSDKEIAGWIELNKIPQKTEEQKKLQNPFEKGSVFNDVGSEINKARDYFIARNILKNLNEGKSVLAVFGANHVIAQKKIFEAYFK
ncbi:MAG: hypothetical protein A2Z88_01945 [Omnitrophica WOR_2 bacterium GWA2_47_8]|nr:MAG: hypothetical protein A2Z88_01945 [Omnitrophica WOR_2 bacterium GWA2_47_8]